MRVPNHLVTPEPRCVVCLRGFDQFEQRHVVHDPECEGDLCRCHATAHSGCCPECRTWDLEGVASSGVRQ